MTSLVRDLNHADAGARERLEAAANWLIVLRHEELNPERVAEWLEWSQADPANLDAFEQMEALSVGLNELGAEFKSAMLRQLAAMPRAIPPGARRPDRPVMYSIAAGLALVAVAAVIFVASRPAAVVTTYATVKAENRSVDLPDGSHVELGASTRLDVDFEAGQRTVDLLQGEAYFTVRHNASRPFVVRAGTLHLIDVGTSFDVRRSGEHVVVTVSEGNVDVQKTQTLADSSDAGGAPTPGALPRVIRVSAGERVTAESSSDAPIIARVQVDQPATWRMGRLTFQDEALSAVISDINRYASREVVIVDPEISSMRFTGTVFEDHVDEWVTGTVHLFGLRSEPTADGKILLHVKDPTVGSRAP